MSNNIGEIDLVVAGAGWFGLSAAKHYIQTHPNDHVIVLESADSCGGTWAAHRLYHGLKSNNMVGSYEYPDYPMAHEKYGLKDDDHIPAAVLHQYLTDYAKHFGVFECVHFNTTVNTIEPTSSDGWTINALSGEGAVTYTTKRLILATGLTSMPNIPSYPGLETFNGPFFHAKDFKARSDTLETCESVVVVGGAKSAYDIAWAYASAGVQVDLLIRPDGTGPVWLAPPFVTPLKRKMEELLHTRILTWFSPTIFGDEDGFSLPRKFLHGTKIGRLLVYTFWHLLSRDVIEANGYEDHSSLAPMKPWYSAFYTGSGVSIHNFDTSLFDLVKQNKIRVHTANIGHLSDRTVHLSTGESLKAGAIICATGWKKQPSFKFLDFDLKVINDEKELAKALENADTEILERFPILKDQPHFDTGKTNVLDPIRLYRYVVPTQSWQKRNLAFAGMISSVSTSTCASLQGLWISAYFADKLDRNPYDDAEIVKEAVINSRWGKWRYPLGYGGDVADFAFDALPYFDMLMKDLGLRNHRKASPMSELIDPYKPWDYNGAVSEWLAAHPPTDRTGKNGI